MRAEIQPSLSRLSLMPDRNVKPNAPGRAGPRSRSWADTFQESIAGSACREMLFGKVEG